MDDGTLGGDVDCLVNDYLTIVREGKVLGLVVNPQKCEIITNDLDIVQKFHSLAPEMVHTSQSVATLLDAPIGSDQGIADVLRGKLEDLKRLSENLKQLNLTIPDLTIWLSDNLTIWLSQILRNSQTFGSTDSEFRICSSWISQIQWNSTVVYDARASWTLKTLSSTEPSSIIKNLSSKEPSFTTKKPEIIRSTGPILSFRPSTATPLRFGANHSVSDSADFTLIRVV